MMAAMFNRCDVVDLLPRHGARVDARDAGGLTALDVARIMGAPDTPQQIAAAFEAIQ
jgi:ankyrin repeat protein